MRPGGLSKGKIQMTSSGIEPATFRLVAQCRVPPSKHVGDDDDDDDNYDDDDDDNNNNNT